MPSPASTLELVGNPRRIDDAIRAIPAEWFRPVRAIYWFDLIVSAVTGWAAFALAVEERGSIRFAFLPIAVVALYRAALFIHELTHRSGRELPGFEFAWNALVGVPLLMPSFLYQGVHLDHHRARTYGTPADPEYVPFGRRSALLILAFMAGSILAPIAFALRFAVLAPIGWLVPAFRRTVDERFSSLVINHAYIRRAPVGVAGRAQEAAACLFVWIAGALGMAGRLPRAALGCWLAAAAAAFALNAFRTLAAHRYDHDADALSTAEQLLDSCTIDALERPRSRALARALDALHVAAAPVGLRYHALHHWIPSLPYHRLGPAHRLLVATLRGDAPYRATIEPGFLAAFRDLLRRSASRTQA